MAIWQFRFSLVPELGIIREHGGVPSELESMKPVNPDVAFDLDAEYPNYWAGQPRPPLELDDFKTLLPPMESWSKNALMFGYSHGHQIELWKDDLICKIDMRAFDPDLLEKCVELGGRNGCLIALHENGQVLAAVWDVILESCQRSRAVKFVCDPTKTLEEIGEVNRARRSKPQDPRQD
jgi:hypothetical protein